MSGQPRLKVPTLTFADKTPTPTRLLKAVDEIGLFREDDKLSSAKSTSSNNPFDEHFRKALSQNDAAIKRKDVIDDVLNTPQIIQESAPPSARVIPPQQVVAKRPPVPIVKEFKPIAPLVETGSESAQLLLRMPSGNTVKLSQIPIFKEPSSEPLASGETLHSDKKRKKNAKITHHDLKERNRAAAARSRKKKKIQNESLLAEIKALKDRNKELLDENKSLRKEVDQLKNQIDISKAPVIITLDQNMIRPS